MLRREGFKEVHFTAGAISVENQRAKVTRYADGVVTGNTVWINATSKKWTVEQLAKHEAFHHQIQDWPYAMDAVRQTLADELGEDGIRELAQRYAEAYEGCYDGAELDAYIEEICADAYAGMDRLPEEKARIVQQAAQRRLEAQSAEKSGETRGPPEKYSINNTRRLTWKAQVNGYFSNDGSVRSSDSLYLGESDVDGVLNAPLYIPTSVINKAVRQPKGSRSAHALTKSDIMKLESGVRNAPAVIVNPARNAIVFVTENADASGSYIIASFDLNNNLFGETAHKSTSIHGQVNLPALFENLGADATIFVKNENKLNQMLPGNQILKSLELLAKVELDDGSVAENSGNVNEKFSAAEDTEEADAEAEAAELQDELTGALVGLARATDNAPGVNDGTWRLMIEGLFTTVTNVCFNEKALRALIDRVHGEKARLVPNCSACASACGRTDDYDMANVWNAQKDIRSLKFLILFGVRGMAAYAHHAMVLGYTDEEVNRFFTRVLIRK